MAVKRQDPAYRPAKGKPRSGGAFLFADNSVTRHGSLREVQFVLSFARSGEDHTLVGKAVKATGSHTVGGTSVLVASR
jgi:hypothetical protein